MIKLNKKKEENGMNKLIYTQPEIEIVEFSEEDIMTASTNSFGDSILNGDPDHDASDWFN